MSASIRPLAEVSQQAREILIREMGVADTLRFLSQFRSGSGDYTKERTRLLGNLTLDEIFSEIKSKRRKPRRSGGAGFMTKFQRVDPHTGKSVEVLLDDPVTDGERWDHYREVDLLFSDGRRYRTAFWRDPQESGRTWWEEPGMVIVPDITDGLILAAIDDLLQQEAVEAACELQGSS